MRDQLGCLGCRAEQNGANISRIHVVKQILECGGLTPLLGQQGKRCQASALQSVSRVGITITCAVLALVVQGAWAAGEVVSNAPPTNAIVAPWRDPFWPVGYLPPPDPASAALTHASVPVATLQSSWQEARKLLQIQGLTRGQSHYLAVINGRMVETGDRVSVELDGVRYRWRVQAIASQGVTLEKMDALVVPGGNGGK